MVLTLTLRAEHKAALRGGTRGLLLLSVEGRGAVGRHGDRGDPAGTEAGRTLDLPLTLRELLALLQEQLVADLGGRDEDGGGVVPVPLGTVGRGPVEDVDHGSPGRNSPTHEVLFAEIFSLELLIGDEGQSPLVVGLAGQQGRSPVGGNLSRKKVRKDEREKRIDLTWATL